MFLEHIRKYLSDKTGLQVNRQDDSGEITLPAVTIQVSEISRPHAGLGNKKIELAVIYEDNRRNHAVLDKIDAAINAFPLPAYLDHWKPSPPPDPEYDKDGETLAYKWDITVFAKSSCRL